MTKAEINHQIRRNRKKFKGEDCDTLKIWLLQDIDELYTELRSKGLNKREKQEEFRWSGEKLKFYAS